MDESFQAIPLYLSFMLTMSWVADKWPFSYHLRTLFLFTRSDFKTVIFPQSVFAIATTLTGPTLTEVESAPSIQQLAYRLSFTLLWIWTNLLVENIANQRLPASVVEDSTNKPWRPMPSGRINSREAQSLLLVAIPVAVAASLLVDAFIPGILLMTLVWMYNDLDGAGISIWVRNLLNGAGLMCFSWGALKVLSGAELKSTAYIWILVTGAIITTTVHAQDFPDVKGDREIGRQTVPLLYGEWPARASLAIGVMAWSIASPIFWRATVVGWIGPLGVGGAISLTTLLKRTEHADAVVWKLWCLWITVIYITPAFAGL